MNRVTISGEVYSVISETDFVIESGEFAFQCSCASAPTVGSHVEIAGHLESYVLPSGSGPLVMAKVVSD